MELILFVAALVLLIIAAIWSWSSGARPATLGWAGLACWVGSILLTRL